MLAALLCGCEKEAPELPYGSLSSDPVYSAGGITEQMKLPLFAEELCAAAEDITEKSTIHKDRVKAACVYDVDAKQVLYSYNANEQLSPASLTKVMTALVTLENCSNLDEKVTVGEEKIREEGAQLFNLKEGDHITVRDLLYATLVHSGNDAALALAVYIGGSEEAFVEMMNAKAAELGASHTHFTNPHGLTNEEHYTCAYDLYLMFNAAAQYPEFLDIVGTSKYTITYTTAEGAITTKEIQTTNQYLSGGSRNPLSVTIEGGKTGSTSAAGKCIILYAVSPDSHPYIVVVMGAEDFDSLYNIATQLCDDTI